MVSFRVARHLPRAKTVIFAAVAAILASCNTPDDASESWLRADYSNGRSYYPLVGQALRLPATTRDRPAEEFLTWHNETTYLG